MKYDAEKHKRKSIRWRMYDYTNNGAYFVTICTHNKKHLFGEVADGEMRLNSAGKMIEQWWNKIPEKFPGITLDEYVVMPNHFHGIIIIENPINPHLIENPVGAIPCNRPSESDNRPPEEYSPSNFISENKNTVIKSGNAENLERAITWNRPYGEIPNEYAGLGQYISWFKRMSTNEYIRRVKMGEFPRFETAVWQRNYWDRVIRNDREILNTREYIAWNPREWEKDEYWGEGELRMKN